MYFGKRLTLRAPAEDGADAGGEDIALADEPEGKDAGDGKAVDRGDDLEQPIGADALKKIAGTDDDAGADAAGDKGNDKKGSAHIPIGRFNEVNEEKKRLERENAELRAAAGKQAEPAKKPEPEKPKFDEDKAEREYANFLAEGEFDKAVALRKQINTHIKEQARDEAVTESDARQSARDTTQTLTQVAAQAVKDWPYLDTEDGADTMELIIAVRDGMVARDMTLPQALKAAVDKIAPKFAPEGTQAPGKDLPQGKAGTDTRSQQANARGAGDSNKQPTRLDGGAGNRAQAGKVDVENMTEEQFDALSPQEKKRLRGDE
jgi:hypothetical protein